MDLESPAAFFRRLVTRRAPDAAEDPANLGTTFGLEASLGPVSTYFAAGEGGSAGAEGEGEGEGPMTWLARRLSRPG